MKIYSCKTVVKIKVGDVCFHISPLSLYAKIRLGDYISHSGGVQKLNNLGYAYKTLQFALRGVDGVEDQFGKPYKLTFDQDGLVTDECMDEISQIIESPQAAAAALQVVSTMKDPQIEGVEVSFPDQAIPAKKNTTSQPA